MKKFILLPFLLIYFLNGQSQIGFNAGPATLNAENWTNSLNIIENTGEQYIGQHLGIDYWFRLKNKRIEFFPEISREKLKETFSFPSSEDQIEKWSFHWNTNFYLLDFEGDCNCPTFSKQGNFLQKGFFIQISPGVTHLSAKADFPGFENTPAEDNFVRFTIGAGVGLDIGITDFLTITPLVRFSYVPKMERENLKPVLENLYENFGGSFESVESSTNQLYAGIRIGFRWKD